MANDFEADSKYAYILFLSTKYARRKIRILKLAIYTERACYLTLLAMHDYEANHQPNSSSPGFFARHDRGSLAATLQLHYR